MNSKLKIIFISISILVLIGAMFFYFHKDERLAFINLDTKECVEKTNQFFAKMHAQVDSNLDYSFAENDSALTGLLGNNYNYVSKKNNNCYAVVKNYNPLTSEYRYSILNVDIEELNPVLFEHNLDASSSAGYREDFLNAYFEYFAS